MGGIYNSGIGGVDLVDRALSQYRSKLYKKKVVLAFVSKCNQSWHGFLLTCLPTQQQKYYTEGLYLYSCAHPDKKVSNNV